MGLSYKMADSRDKPELETLNYIPKPLKRGFMGLNANVIKPETRVNKSEITCQHFTLCKCKDCMSTDKVTDLSNLPGREHHKDCECGNCPEQPNQNLMIIEEIEGLISQANEKMYDLPVHPVRSKAIEEIDILLRITIKKQLRRAFE